MVPTIASKGEVLVLLMQHYKWKTAIILGSSKSFRSLGETFEVTKKLRAAGIKVPPTLSFEPGNSARLSLVLHQIKKSSIRIVIMMAPADGTIRAAALTIKQRSMSSQGWAWLSTQQPGGSEARLDDYRAANGTKDGTTEEDSCFQGWLYLQPVLSEEGIQDFAANVSKHGQDFGASAEAVHLIYSGALHDAIILYAHAATKVLSEGEDLLNGKAVTDAVRSVRFTGIGGNVVELDSSGDRVMSHQVMNYVARVDGRIISVPVGAYDQKTRLYKHERLTVWPGDTDLVPLDKAPVDAESDNTRTFIYAGAAGVTVLSIGALLVYNIRKHKERLKEFLKSFVAHEGNLVIEQVLEVVDILGDVFSVI